MPKKQPVKVMNDLHPVALTSCVMKVFERVVLVHLQEQLADFMYPFQLAYRENRSVDDAILQVLNCIYSHLENLSSDVLRFSSAFNTIQPHLLSEKLLTMNVQASTIMWILDYFTNRPQCSAPAASCYRTEFYIGRHLHQYGYTTGDRFVAIFVFSVYGRLQKLSW